MATGYSGSFTIAGTKYMSARCYWSETYNEANNTHVVSIDRVCLISTNWYGFTYYPNGTISVGGSNVISFSSASGGHSSTVNTQNAEYPIVAASGYSSPPWVSGTIYGNTDGSCSVTISMNFTGLTVNGSGANGFQINGSSTVTLYTIPRKSTVSMSNATMGTATTITVSRASSAFTHTLTYSFGNTSGTIATKTSSTSVSWTPPLSLANQIPSSTSGTVTITCQTYSGSTLIGTSTRTATLSVPASVKPSLTALTATRVDGTVPSSWGIYVQTKSKVTLAITGAAGSYGSTISAYSISGGGFSSTASSYTTGYLGTSGSITFTGKVQDSRGRWSDSKTVTISVVAYSPPAFSSYQTQRCTSAGTVTTNGTYAKGKASFSYSGCSGKNSVTTAVAYKKSSDTTYTSVSATFSNDTAFIFGSGNLATDYTYDIRYTLTDAFGSVRVVDKLSTASVVMDFKAGGLGVAVGKVSETDKCFEVADDWDVKLYGMLLESYIASKAPKGIAFCTCDTAEATVAKVVTSQDSVELKQGQVIAVQFEYGNTASSPTMNVNGTGARAICGINGTYISTQMWTAKQIVQFVFNGTWWVAIGCLPANTSRYGITKLSSSVTSTSTSLAATPSAVKQAYDRNSWTSISLTNALAIAYGGTGATSAAGARSNLGIAATSLYSGTLTTGSTTFSYGYKLYVIIGQPASTASRCAVVIPGSQITTTATSYQFADESYYYSFNLSYPGSTITLAYKGRSSSGQIIRIFGIN